MLVIVSEMGRGRRRSSAGGRERRFQRSASSSIKCSFEGLKLNWQTHARTQARGSVCCSTRPTPGDSGFSEKRDVEVEESKRRSEHREWHFELEEFEEFLTNPWDLFHARRRAHTEHQELERK